MGIFTDYQLSALEQYTLITRGKPLEVNTGPPGVSYPRLVVEGDDIFAVYTQVSSTNDALGISRRYGDIEFSRRRLSELPLVNGDHPHASRRAPITPATLRSMAFASSSAGWAAGSAGTILRTDDSGLSWRTQSNPAPVTTNLRAIVALNSDMAIAVGDNGLQLKTTDGGSTWQPSTPTQKTLYGLAFGSPNSGLATGGDGVILRTTDAGNSWTNVLSPAVNQLNSVCFSGVTTAWICGNDGTLMRSTNSGGSWELVQTPSGRTDFNYIAFDGLNHGFIAGQNGVLLETHDQGTNWSRQDILTSEDLKSAVFVGPDQIYVTGDQGTILSRYADGGWLSHPATPLHLLFATAAQGSSSLWTAGWDGELGMYNLPYPPLFLKLLSPPASDVTRIELHGPPGARISIGSSPNLRDWTESSILRLDNSVQEVLYTNQIPTMGTFYRGAFVF